ncbi:MAG: DUF4832 domain-containing protein [Nitrosomonas sp.]
MNNKKLTISRLPFLHQWLTMTTLVFAANCYLSGASANGLQSLSNQVRSTSIVVDGDRKGWEQAIPFSNDPVGDKAEAGHIDWENITIAHDCDDLHIRYKVLDGPAFVPDGYRYNLLVDIDKNLMTGFRGSGNSLSIGADVLIQGGQNKVTIFKFTGDSFQEAWNWQQINFYPVSDMAGADGRRDIDFSLKIADLNVMGLGVPSFNWIAWADHATAIKDYYPDNGFIGDGGDFYTYTLSYKPMAGSIANPERGFFASAKTKASHYIPLDPGTLQCYIKNEGISLVHRYFYLDNFANSDISQQYLDLMQADFNLIRQAGLKVIPRFSYSETSGPNLTPPYGDASKDRILAHLNQLSGILNKHSDVIAVMEAGFIGLWGEWWYSDHFQPDSDWSKRAEVVFGMLDVLPANRMIQLRTPRSKQNLFSDASPVDSITAHTGSQLARTGHHNDCFVSSQSDGGTFINSSEYAYLAEETKWLPMGGETCDYNSLSDPNPSRLSCATALNELAKFHWSFLNLDWYKPLLRKWVDEGCYAEIEKRLGYYFTLLTNNFDSQIKPGEQFKFNLQLKNEGFAAPFNPRLVELILRHSNGSLHTFKLQADPRFWLPGQIHAINGEITIPENLPAGDYELLLNLPDPETELYRRPEYSIRLANSGIWETSTGYNKLNRTFIVEPAPVYADRIAITVGKYDTGTITSLKAKDADTYDIKAANGSGGKITDWNVSANLSTSSPDKISELNIMYSGQYSKKNVKQDIYLYNFKNSKWDLMDSRSVGNTNDVVVLINPTTPQFYLSSDGRSRLRIRGFKSGTEQFYSWANAISWKIK